MYYLFTSANQKKEEPKLKGLAKYRRERSSVQEDPKLLVNNDDLYIIVDLPELLYAIEVQYMNDFAPCILSLVEEYYLIFKISCALNINCSVGWASESTEDVGITIHI